MAYYGLLSTTPWQSNMFSLYAMYDEPAPTLTPRSISFDAYVPRTTSTSNEQNIDSRRCDSAPASPTPSTEGRPPPAVVVGERQKSTGAQRLFHAGLGLHSDFRRTRVPALIDAHDLDRTEWMDLGADVQDRVIACCATLILVPAPASTPADRYRRRRATTPRPTAEIIWRCCTSRSRQHIGIIAQRCSVIRNFAPLRPATTPRTALDRERVERLAHRLQSTRSSESASPRKQHVSSALSDMQAANAATRLWT